MADEYKVIGERAYDKGKIVVIDCDGPDSNRDYRRFFAVGNVGDLKSLGIEDRVSPGDVIVELDPAAVKNAAKIGKSRREPSMPLERLESEGGCGCGSDRAECDLGYGAGRGPECE